MIPIMHTGIRKGTVGSHQELADLADTDRSHISTILRLRFLAPDIQEWLLNQPESENGKDPVGLMELRSIASIPSWDKQKEALHALVPDLYSLSAPKPDHPAKAH